MPFDSEILLLENLYKYLSNKGLSAVSSKNYLSDVRGFLKWLKTVKASQEKGLSGSGRMHSPGVAARTSKKISNDPGSEDVAQARLVSTLSAADFHSYKSDLISKKLPRVTINRRLSSLRKFGQFLKDTGLGQTNPASKLTNLTAGEDPKLLAGDYQRVLSDFAHNLHKIGNSKTTIKLYLSDIKQYLNWAAEVVEQ